jgi:serine/threonine-protein kinase
MAEDITDPLIGQMLDHRLRILRRIGQGGMGTVYAAEHIGLGKQVAVKILSEAHAADEPVAARLLAEARHASAIRNEHIVEIFDIGRTAEGRTFVVMELLPGESLAQRLARQGALSQAEVLSIGRQLASALAAAHEQGIMHRDVKPENTFLCPREEGDFVKVLDFGLSKALRGKDPFSPRLTQTGLIIGTPLYMSPEQARGDEQLDHRIDIYAFGVVLYECLTGEVPFSASNYLGVINKILTSAPVPPRQRRPDLPISSDLERVVLRAMAADRETRYQSLTEAIEDLERIEVGGPLPKRPDENRWGQRLLVLGLCLVFSLGLAIALWPAPPPVQPPARAERPAPAPVPSPAPAPPPPAPLTPAPEVLSAPPPPAALGKGAPHPRPGADLDDFLREEQAPNPFRRKK